MAAFRSFITRLLEIPMSQTNFKQELDVIFQIAVNNGYTKKCISKLFNVQLQKFIDKKYLYNVCPLNTPKKWRSVLFTGKTSYKIAQVIEKEKDVKIAFYNNNNLKNKLCNMKDPIPPIMKSGIYKIRVPGHGEYIGKTSRAINTRIKENFSVKNKHPEKRHDSSDDGKSKFTAPMVKSSSNSRS
uniref:Uncharacterized protein n=1 Tax=Cacopsylla melanoneura TaxID=428564 RepID=A0A8D9BPU2_9HEMI